MELKTKTYDKPQRDKFSKLLMAKVIGETTAPDHALYTASGYEANTTDIARANATRLKKHPEVQETVGKFKDQLNKSITNEDRTNKAKELFSCGDKRVELTMWQELVKINDEYPAQKSKFVGLIAGLSDLE